MQRILKRLGVIVGAFALLLITLGIILFIGVARQSKSVQDPGVEPSQFTAAGSAESGTATAPGSAAATSDDPSIGPENAQVTVVEFSDFECPFCKQSFPIVRELMLRYGDRVRFVYRDFPISSIHKHAQKAGEAGACAHAQGKFWALHDKIFQNAPRIAVADLKQYARTAGLDGVQFDRCLDSDQFAEEVQQDFRDGTALGVRGTPTWFLNGYKVEGVIPRETFMTILDQLLATP